MNWYQKIRLLIISTIVTSSMAFGQSQYVVNGNAYSTSCDCYTLTNPQSFLVGSVWNSNLLDLSLSFDMTFEVFLGCNDGGADGMVFGLQPVGTNIGSSGGGMGMSGVSPAVGIYIDTYMNGIDFDPAADHLSIQTNGDNIHDNSPNDLTLPIVLPNMEDCNFHDLHVIWDATLTQLTVLIDGTLYANIVVDLVTTVFSGNPNVYWGFTAATGGLSNEQKFCIQADLLIDVSADSICINESITLADSSIIAGGIVSREWDFGDNSPLENMQSVIHSYSVPGTYSVSLNLTDVSGCVYNITKDIVVLAPVINTLVTNSACNACNGAFEIQATASAGPYQYSIDGGLNFQNDSIFTGLCGAQNGQNYNLVVIDQFGCQNTEMDSVFDDAPEIDNVELVNSECQNSTGAVSIGTTTNGGTAPYVYSIVGVVGFQSLPINNLAPNSPASYNLVVQDFFGCTDTAAITITILDQPFLSPVQTVDESCLGICDGSASVTGVNLVNYSIDNGTTYSTSGVFNNLCAGVYNVVVNNNFGCELFDQFTITKPDSAVPTIATDVISGCEPLTVEFSNLSTGPIVKSEWSFSDGPNLTTIGLGNVVRQFDNAGIYDISLTTTTVDGCVFTETWPSYIDVFAAPEASYIESPSPVTVYNTIVNFTNTSSLDVTAWDWNFGLGADITTSSKSNPIVIYPEGIEATYPVKLLVSNDNGCEDSIVGQVKVVSDLTVFAPNIFTPTANKINNSWRVFASGIDYYDFHLTLFNRWGEVIWESYDPDASWNGSYGSGELVQNGTFIWLLEARGSITDKVYDFRGTVTVLK
ncbi:MAG: PKD domain-containing protein [Crocinitomicaceae bacterium]